MATKSFTTEFSFNRKNAESLISALNNTKKPKKRSITNVTRINDKNVIRCMFGGLDGNSNHNTPSVVR